MDDSSKRVLLPIPISNVGNKKPFRGIGTVTFDFYLCSKKDWTDLLFRLFGSSTALSA
jgi:hypothetical protein